VKEKPGLAAVERLDTAYCCTLCKAVYLFASDVEDHQQATGHSRPFIEMPLGD
jgi:hypothetical protein